MAAAGSPPTKQENSAKLSKRPEVSASRSDRAVRPRLIDVGGQRLRGCEMTVPLDGQAQPAAHGLKLRDAHGTGLRAAHAEIAQAEAEIGVLGIEFREKPGASGIGCEEFHDRHEVRFG